eukprot:CAMPEP_0205811902 /NCGR_PEP_ID=MMETSP0205-20121125/16182_1 /ASSEMBLY_ACC=CAM_ASM_000278 /TAXON_ID=36767 /ORGANISM="Euplotes focardii, Strain TN1" /LENGTH=61 /DNA_ID=CAMNT_0053091697 /DNA_START=375 /DNA_END=557 /DNA_ORIENTATION=-
MIFYLAYDWIDIIRPKIKKMERTTMQGNNEIIYEEEDQDYFLHSSSSYQESKSNDLSYWIW